jgi:hypothetical protein
VAPQFRVVRELRRPLPKSSAPKLIPVRIPRIRGPKKKKRMLGLLKKRNLALYGYSGNSSAMAATAQFAVVKVIAK